MKWRVCLLALGVLTAATFGQPWSEQTPMPYGATTIYSGGCLAAVPESLGATIYGAKGHRTTEFYVYDVTATAWAMRAPVPLGVEGKPVYDGACMVYDGARYVYFVKGNYTLGFYRYDTQADSWREMMNIPLGVYGTKVSGGTDIVYVTQQGRGYLYLLKGYYNEFYLYDIAADTWGVLPPAPVGVNEHWPDGSWLVFDGDSTIYAHKAYYHELWVFHVVASAWDTTARLGMPFIGRSNTRARAGDGSCGTWHDGSFFALKGNGTNQFWQYYAARDSWVERETIPPFGSTGRMKKVRNGGDLVTLGGLLYAQKGNYCNEFWRYTPTPTGVEEGCTLLDASLAKQVATVVRGVLYLRPSPFPLSEREGQGARGRSVLLDVTGRRVMSLLPGPNDVRHLAPGVYFVRANGDRRIADSKVILAR